jgi:hypothetical protein
LLLQEALQLAGCMEQSYEPFLFKKELEQVYKFVLDNILFCEALNFNIDYLL